MPLRNPRAERNRRIALKAWLKEQDAWNGHSIIPDPKLGYVDAEIIKAHAEVRMGLLDRMPPDWRALINDFGDIKLLRFREMSFSAATVRQMAVKAIGVEPL